MKLKSRQRRAGAIAAALTLALTMSACVASGPGGNTGTDDAVPDPTATLRVGSVYGPENLDPHDAPSAGYLPFIIPVYDRLMELDENLELQPMLATEWNFVDDGAALELKLRDDVDFHDGAHFDASVVIANFERIQALGAPTPKRQLSPIDTFEALDDYTVRLNLKPGAGADLPTSLASFAGFMISPNALDKESLDFEPAGSGPYILEEGSFRQSETASFVRAEEPYWGGGDDVRPAKLVLTSYTDQNALFNALQGDQIDLIMTEPTARVDSFKADPNFEVLLHPGGYYQLQMNLEWPGLEDLRVRQALAYAIDREAIEKGVMAGSCAPTNQPLASFMNGYVADLEGTYDYNPEKARDLLAEAGYADGLELPGLYAATAPYDALATALQAMLGEVGVTANWSPTTIAEAQVLWREKTAALHAPGATFRGDSSVQLLTFSNGNAGVPGGTTPEVQEATAPLTDPMLSGDELVKAREAATTAIVETLPGIIICQRQKVVIANSSVHGIEDMPSVLGGSYDTVNLWVAKS